VAIRKPSEYFDREKASVENAIQGSIENPELNTFSDAYDAFKRNLSKVDVLTDFSETLGNYQSNIEKVNHLSEKIDEIDGDIKKLLTKEDLDKALVSQLLFLEECIRDVQEKVKGINQKNLTQVKLDVSSLSETVNTFIDDELPRYEKLVSDSEIRLTNRCEVLEEELKETLDNIKDVVDEKYVEDFNSLNEELGRIKKNDIPKYKNLIIDSEIKTESKIKEFAEFLDNTVNDVVSKIELVKEDNTEIFDTLNSKVSEVNQIHNLMLEDIEKSETTRDELDKKVVDLKIEILRNESHIENQNKSIETIHEDVKSAIDKLSIEEIQKNNSRLASKVKYIEEVFEKFNEKELLSENIITEPSSSDNSDPLTPLDQKFVTLDQLQSHYRLFVNRIQQQLSSLGGGGETRLKYLDDVVGIATNASVYDGKFLKYDHSIEKFEFVTVSGGGGGSQTLDETLELGDTSTRGMSVGVVTSTKLHVDSVGSGVTYSEDLVVVGNGRVTGILSIGTSSIILDPNAKKITGIEEVELGTTTLKHDAVGNITFVNTTNPTEIINVGIGTSVSVNTSGIITALSFSGSGVNLTNIPNTSLDNNSVSFGGVSLDLGGTDATPAFNLSNATGYFYTSLSGITTSIEGDATPKLGGNLNLNSNNITGNGNVDITGVVTAISFVGNLTGTASTATSLSNSRTFQLTGDIIASPISFDGTGNVSLAATIQPNSVALGGDTTGNYVSSISGTGNQITVTAGTGEGSTPTISIPDNSTLPGTTVTIANDLQVNRDLHVTGNVTIGGTSATLFSETLKISDPDIIVGFRTDAAGNDISNDTTANHGGIGLASTEGSPLVSLVNGGEPLPDTYKKIMWFKSGSFTGLATDAWLSNYAFGVGTTSMSAGTKFAVGNIETDFDDITSVRNINSSGIITANIFSGSASNLTGLATSLSELTNDVGFITTSFTNTNQLTNGAGFITGVSTFSGDYGDLSNKPTIPTNTNQLTNGAGFITTSFTNTNQLTNGAGFITTSFTNTNQLTNGAGFITNNVSGTVTATSFVKSGGTSSQFLMADGTTSTGGGGGATDKIEEGNTSAEVIDTGSDGRFVVKTEGSERLRIDSSGRTGIGTNNPQSTLEINVGTALSAFDIQGSAGQLFSVTNNLTSGSIFSVNDVSGIPSIDVDADGTIQLAPFGATEKVGIGTTNPTSKLHVNGNVTATSFVKSGGTSSQFLMADGTTSTGGGGISNYVKYVGTGTPNLNASTSYSELSWINTTPQFSNGTWSATSSHVVVPNNGIYLVQVNFYITTSVQRSNIGLKFAVNNTQQTEISANNYIRSASGHNESSINMATTLSLSASDQISIYIARLSNSGTVSLQGTSSTLAITQLV